jgi:hypothetical protein
MSWIGVDFDGTLAQYEGWRKNGLSPGGPNPAYDGFLSIMISAII